MPLTARSAGQDLASAVEGERAVGNLRVRVAVYVVRDSSRGLELLVFDHRDYPEAGTQISAGGVDTGESIEEAVLREVLEETGLAALTLHRSLGIQQRPRPHTGQPRVTIFYHVSTSVQRSRWSHYVTTSTGGDAGMTFERFFIPLIDAVGLLADRQDKFVDKLLSARNI